MTEYSSPNLDLMLASKAWPYEQARRLIGRKPKGEALVFETGYGPSGLPHIGTFAEVYRTSLVRRAYEQLTGEPTRLIVFSDDMDALRKTPDNVPNQDMMTSQIGVSLSRVPDPFGQYESFAHHNNAMLRRFLDNFGFDYEFMSATEMYRSGAFNEALSTMWDRYDDVMDIILPTVGPERRASYSPFMPVLSDGQVIMEGVTRRSQDGSGRVRDWVEWQPGDDVVCRSTILDGYAKCQWKADWAMRWLALGVDYEMAGKDLIDSVTLSSKIVRALGGKPPVTMIYELFLDEEGRKIAKSKGNGLTIDQWLDYGSRDSLKYYLFQNPQKAHKLHAETVPRAMDDYNDALRRYPSQTAEQQLGNAASHIHPNGVPEPASVSYALLLNTAATVAPRDPASLWRYVERYVETAQGSDHLNELVLNVFNYFWNEAAEDYVKRPATESEQKVLADILIRLDAMSPDSDEETIQTMIYEVGKEHYGKEQLRSFFAMLYEVTLGQSSGPRFGAFIKLLGFEDAKLLISNIKG